MKFTRLSGTVIDGAEIKGVGDIVVVDGVKHTVDEVNTYHETWDGNDVHKFDYTLKAIEVVEKTAEDLQKL